MYNSILVPVDLNQESSWKKALPIAIDMVQKNGGELHIVTVIPDYGMSLVGSFFPPDHTEKALAAAQKDLAKFVTDHVPPTVNATAHVKVGTIYKRIMRTADEVNCSLIVMASHRPETKDYLLGPNAARVVRHATQSVFIVRDS
jgi:nucleotide-binding universal stress UspA family protein